MVSNPVKERLGKELRRIGKKGGLNLQGLMSEFSIERRTTQRDMKLLKDAGFVEFAGPDKTGKYVLTGKGQKIFNT
jgi:predicted transcriptional regulator